MALSSFLLEEQRQLNWKALGHLPQLPLGGLGRKVYITGSKEFAANLRLAQVKKKNLWFDKLTILNEVEGKLSFSFGYFQTDTALNFILFGSLIIYALRL